MLALIVAYGIGVLSGVQIHRGIVAIEREQEAIEREAEAIAAAQEAADIIEEATNETATVIKERMELQDVISRYEKEERKRISHINTPVTCPTVTCIDGLFIKTWNSIATKTDKSYDEVRKSESAWRAGE